MPNSFILTNFIEEVSEPIVISENLGLYFDNPKTSTEIEIVARRLKSIDIDNTRWEDLIGPAKKICNL